MMSLKVEEIESFSEMKNIEDRWNQILKTSREDTFFLSMPWMSAWWDTFGKEHELKCLAVYENRDLVGIAPFAISSRGRIVPWKKLILIGSGPSDRCGIIAENGRSDIHQKIWEFISDVRGWDVAELRDINVTGPTYLNFVHRFPTAETINTRSPYIDVSNGYEKYAMCLSHNMRYNISRYKRKIEANGGTYDKLDSKDSKKGINMLKELSNARWESDNVLKQAKMIEFAQRVAQIKTSSSSTVFNTINFEGSPIAVAMGFIDENRYMYYLSGFDPQYSKWSPGYVLISEIIKECCENKITEIDLLRGTEDYKYRFNAVDRIQSVTRIVNNGLIRHMESRIREGKLAQ